MTDYRRLQETRRALRAAAPAPETTDAQKVQGLHSELRLLDAGYPDHWSDHDRQTRRDEVTRSLRKFGDVV
jgi:hypothetical protein